MPFVKFCWQTSEKQLHKKEKKQLLQFYWRKSIMLNSSHFLQFPGNRLWTTECELLHRKDTTGVMTSGGPLPIYTTCWFSSQYRRWTKGFLLLFFFFFAHHCAVKGRLWEAEWRWLFVLRFYLSGFAVANRAFRICPEQFVDFHITILLSASKVRSVGLVSVYSFMPNLQPWMRFGQRNLIT